MGDVDVVALVIGLSLGIPFGALWAKALLGMLEGDREFDQSIARQRLALAERERLRGAG